MKIRENRNLKMNIIVRTGTEGREGRIHVFVKKLKLLVKVQKMVVGAAKVEQNSSTTNRVLAVRYYDKWVNGII